MRIQHHGLESVATGRQWRRPRSAGMHRELRRDTIAKAEMGATENIGSLCAGLYLALGWEVYHGSGRGLGSGRERS